MARHPDIIVNGLRYYVGSNGPASPSHYKGFGGRKYTIRFNDGALLRTDDLMWDYSHKTHSRPDTGIILEGWQGKLPTCAWQPAGEYIVFGPVR